MPYSISKNHSSCPSSKPHAVTRDDGTVVPGGCHKSRGQAVSHQRALMVNVPDAQKKRTAREDESLAAIEQEVARATVRLGM
jgi:hypothetical protein